MGTCATGQFADMTAMRPNRCRSGLRTTTLKAVVRSGTIGRRLWGDFFNRIHPICCRSKCQAAHPIPAVAVTPNFRTLTSAMDATPVSTRPFDRLARRSLTGETLPVRRDPSIYELREKPYALSLTRFALCEDPESPVHVKVGTRHAFKLRIGIADKAR